jgi:DNA-binding HxlR family transcriptional regulator
MKRTSFEAWDCSVARTVDIIGEVWTPLILRDLFWGIRRFEDLQADLGIARNILSDRLRTLVDHGIVTKEPYQDRPVRHEYRLTEKGRDLAPVLLALLAWGDKWMSDEPPVPLRHLTCGELTTPVMTCEVCGEPLRSRDLRFERSDAPSEEVAGRR